MPISKYFVDVRVIALERKNDDKISIEVNKTSVMKVLDKA